MAFRKNRVLRTLVGLLLALLVFYVGFKVGSHKPGSVSIMNSSAGEPSGVDFAPFWKAWNIIQQNYVAASTTHPTTTDQQKVYGAIGGLASSLGDPYTVFFPPAENQAFSTEIAGNFEGVGMEVQAQGGAITVIAPLKGSPAANAGILAGDRITKINGKDTSSMTTDEAVNLIRGKSGTSVKITVVRGAKPPFDVSITRQVINLPTLETKELPGKIFEIELYSFTATSPDLFRNALRKFVQSGDSKLVLDLRGNPGGYLEAAIDMASWFLPPGKVVVKEDFGPGKEPTIYRSKGYDVFNDNLKFVILVDNGSASAAEILAAALNQQGKATLVGEKTFGKGSVQQLFDITPDTSLKVTVARWLTPNGSWISGVGITPQYVVDRSEADIKAGRDPQLDKAIEILNQ